MSSNRFDQNANQQYVSTYAPLPLHDLSKMAKDHQDKYDKAVEDTYKLQDVMANVHAIDKHQPYKQALDAKYSPLVEDISNRIAKGNDIPTAERDMHRLVRQFQSDPMRQELEASYANYGAYQKDKIAKGDKYGEHHDPTMSFTGSNKDNSIAPFRYTGMGEIQDHAKESRSQMADIGKDGSLKDITQLDGSGNIIGIKKGYEGIVDKKVRGLAHLKTPSFLLTKEGQDFAKMISYKNPKADVQRAAEEYLYNAGANQIQMNTKSGNDFHYAPEYIHDEKNQQSDIGMGQTLPGSTVDSYDSTPDALKHIVNDKGEINWQGTTVSGVKSADGKVKYFKNWTDAHDYYLTNHGEMVEKKEISDTEHKDLYNYVKESAKMLGKDIGNIKSNQYADIIAKRKELDTVLHPEYQFTPGEKKIEKANILTNRSNYAAFDINKKPMENPLLDPKVAATFQPDRKTYNDSKVETKGTYVDSDNKLQHVTFRSLSQEKNKFYDGLAQTQNNTMHYIKTGKLSSNLPETQVKDLEKALKLGKDLKIADIQTIGKHDIVTVVNPNDRTKMITYELAKDEKGNVKPYMIGSVADLHKLTEKWWYGDTNEGRAEMQNLPSNNKLYDEISNEVTPQQ